MTKIDYWNIIGLGVDFMKSLKQNKNEILCVLSIIIIVASYAVERLIEIFFTPTKTFALAIGTVFTALAVVVFLILWNTKNPFLGLLTSLLGYKMMPPSINMLTEQSLYGEEAYYLACKLAIALYVILIIKFFRMQTQQEKIKALPILAIMFVVPFFNEIASDSYTFVMTKTRNMLYYYFLTFACYIVASLVILAVAYKSNYESVRFTAYFEFVAIGVNILKRLGAIVAIALQGAHISKSYYCWIAIYVVLILCFYLALKKSKKSLA